ncbi:MAG: HlyD family secretion protein [Terriglobales bacterium]
MKEIMEPEKDQKVPAETSSRKNKMKLLLLAGGILAVVAGTWYYLYSRAFESTDNAFIDGSVVQISPRVPGQVLRVYVQDNQHVNKGDVIAEIDPRDYQTQLDQAQAGLKTTTAHEAGAQSGMDLTSVVTGAVLVQATAGLDAARDQVSVLRAQVTHAQAQMAAAEAEAHRAGDDAQRYKTLHDKDEVSRQLLDRAETEARATAANLDAARQEVAAAKAQLELAEKQVQQAKGRLLEAQSAPEQVQVRKSDVQSASSLKDQQSAAVRQAELNLSYTKIYAPDSGYITKKSVEPGNFVQTGQVLMALVSDRLWVTANFKETQLEYMRAGQPVTVQVDAYPQLRLRGHVDSIQSGSGARFSLLPPENATGNYVKVVQRVPVKIVIDDTPSPEYRLGPGLSVVPEVKVR